MISDIKNTLYQSSVYGISRVALKLVSFILIPIYSSVFTPEIFGVNDRIDRIWQIILPLILFGLETAIVRWYFLSNDQLKRKSLLSTVLIFILFNSTIILILSIFFAEKISIFIFSNSDYKHLIIFAAFISFFEALLTFPLILLRINENVKKYLIITISVTILNLLFQLYFLLYSNFKLEGITISKFIAPAIVFLFTILFIKRNIDFKFNFKILKEVILFSFPLMLTGIVSILLMSVNRFILDFVGNSFDVGIFSMAINICGVLIFFFITPFQLAFNVIFWKKVSEENAKRFFSKLMTYSIFAYAICTLFLSLIGPYIIRILINESYFEAINLLPILSFGLIFYGTLVIIYMSYHYSNRNNLILYFQIAALILNIILSYLLIPILGIYGTSIAFVTSFAFLSVGMYLYSKRIYFIKYELNKIFIMLSVSALLIIINNKISSEIMLFDLFIKLISIIIFPFILYIFNFYEKYELRTFHIFISKYLRKK